MKNKEIKSMHIIVNNSDSTLRLYNNPPKVIIFETTLKNSTINFYDNNVIEVVGNKIEWGFSFDKVFIDDLKDKPAEGLAKFGYKNLFDFFKGIKKPYVNPGWYQLEKTTSYRSIMPKWQIITETT